MNKKQKIITLLVILLIFIGNSGHLIQQGTYNNYYLPIAEHLLEGDGYTCYEFNNQPAFYPMWGYTFLVELDQFLDGNAIFLVLVQFALAYYGIVLFYKIFNLKFKYLHLFLFLPYFALMSVKWPDAIAGFLLILYVFYSFKGINSSKLNYALLAGLTLGILSNFRAEYLYLGFFNFALLLFKHFKGSRNYLLKYCIYVLVISFLCMVPWSLRYYLDTKNISFSSSNGGAVMYVSLGQLSDNPWGIVPVDSVAIKYVNKFGLKNQYTPEADKLLYTESIRLIEEYPSSYCNKCFDNLLKVGTGGVYTGEYGNLFIPVNRRDEINKEMANIKGYKNLSFLFSLNPN